MIISPPPPPSGPQPPGDGGHWNIGDEANGFVLTERGWVATDATKAAALAVAVAHQVAAGGVTVQQGDHWALLAVTRQADQVNHVLHLLLSVLTCGAWVLVWIILAVVAKPAQHFTVRIDVDDSGRATTNRLGNAYLG